MRHRILKSAAWTAILCFAWMSRQPLLGASNPDDADAGFNQALAAVQDRDITKAIALLEQNLSAHPKDARSQNLMGQVLSMQGRDQEALPHLEEAVKLSPGDHEFWTDLAVDYLRLSRLEESERALHRSIEVAPNHLAFLLLGNIRIYHNEPAQALQFFKKSLDLDPSDPQSWYSVGLAYSILGETNAALANTEGALRRAPDDFDSHLLMGRLLLNRGRGKEALDHLLAAEHARPESAEVYELLRRCYLSNGDLQSALDASRRAAELEPNNPRFHYQLGLLLAQLGKQEESEKEFRLFRQLYKRPSPVK